MTIAELKDLCSSHGLVYVGNWYWREHSWTFPGECYSDSAFVRSADDDMLEICCRNMGITGKEQRVMGWVEQIPIEEDETIAKNIETMCLKFKELTKEIRKNKIEEL